MLVVTRPETLPLLDDIDLAIDVFGGAAQGMGATLAHGIGVIQDVEAGRAAATVLPSATSGGTAGNLSGKWAGCLVCLGDMPFIRPETYQALSARLRPDNIVIPCFDGKPGNPVGFGRDYFPELACLSGDQGGRELIAGYPQAVLRLDIDDPAILQDIDTPADLLRLDEPAN